MNMLLLLFLITCTVSAAKTNCLIRASTVTCSFAQQDNIYEGLSIVMTPEEVHELNVSYTSIPVIDKTLFGRYKNIRKLALENDSIKIVVEGAFVDLHHLRQIYLGHNLLETFSFEAFGDSNALFWLDLSNNRLEDLSGFNVSFFPFLTVLDVSNNRLKYLPEDLVVGKLRKINSYHLKTDNNPWNCSHPRWSHYLTSSLVAALCLEGAVDLGTAQVRIGLQRFAEDVKNSYANGENCPKKCPNRHWCFSYCVFWFIGAVWIGIILGNVCKLRDIVCRTSLRMQDANTQYDKMDLRAKYPEVERV